MIDASIVGREWSAPPLLITRSRLRMFAKATGQTDPIYVDVDAARRAGHPDLPAPPTFVFAAELELADPFSYLTEAGVDLRSVLHGEQEFRYHKMVFAGDEVCASSRVVDLYEKKAGELTFVVKESTVTDRGSGAPVATMRSTLVIRRLPEVDSQ